MVGELATWKQVRVDAFIVDNSQDIDRSLAAEHIHLMTPASNLGYAEGCNEGMRAAMTAGCDVVILLNADLAIDEKRVLALLQTMDDGDFDAVAPALVEARDGQQQYHYGGRNPLYDSQTRIIATEAEAPAESPVYLPGTVLLIKSATLRRVGLLDANYFFSGEVADWFLQHGQSISFVVDTDVYVEHHQRGNTKARRGTYIYYSLRNRYLLIEKHGGTNKSTLRRNWTKQLRRQMLGALIRFDFNKFMTIYRAVRDGRAGKFGKSEIK